jgi:hypothetical protein
VSYRLLAFVSGLTLGDYMLWNWSLSNNRDVLALISGLTLPPIAAAFVWLLALSVARAVSRSSHRTSILAGPQRAGGVLAHRRQRPAPELDHAVGSLDEPPVYSAPTPAPSPRKLAA